MSYAIHPFEYLKALELCASRYAIEMPQEDSSVTYWDGVGFALNEYRFTVGISEIAEILPVPQITPLPGVKHWARGVANIHGRLIPVVDLRTFFELPQQATSNSNRVIVIDQKALSVGLIVDEVHGRQHLPTSGHQPRLPAGLPDSILPFTSGCYQQDSDHIVFDVGRLMASDAFLAAANE